MLLIVLVCTVTAICTPITRTVSDRGPTWLMIGVLVLAVIPWMQLTERLAEERIVLAIAVVCAALWALLTRSTRRAVQVSTFALCFTAAMVFLLRTEVVVDVQDFLEGGLKALMAGASPYGITVQLPYSSDEIAAFFPDGPVEHGRVPYGYPYLPVPLLLDVPAYLLGEVRWMHIACLLAASLLAWRLSSDGVGRAAALLIALNPLSSAVVLNYWIEPVIVLLLALCVTAMSARRSVWVGLVLGLLFSSKQYAVSFVPALLSVARRTGWRPVLLATGVGIIVVGGAFVWDPRAFLRSAGEFPMLLGVRTDSVSLLAAAEARGWGPLPSWLYLMAPGCGFAVGLIVALRTRPGATAFALGVGVSLLMTFLLAKQSFHNYYFLAGTALLLAGVTWPSDPPTKRGSDVPRSVLHPGARR